VQYCSWSDAHRELTPLSRRHNLPSIALLPLVKVRAGAIALLLVEAWLALKSRLLMEPLLLVIAALPIETCLLLLLLRGVVWAAVETVLRRLCKPARQRVSCDAAWHSSNSPMLPCQCSLDLQELVEFQLVAMHECQDMGRACVSLLPAHSACCGNLCFALSCKPVSLT